MALPWGLRPAGWMRSAAGPLVLCVESIDLPDGHGVDTLRVDPEAALRSATQKFRGRFEQVEQLARIVDELQIDVFAFGILTDFRSSMFPGSSRLVELADRMNVLQVEALCWCGKRATHNARTEDGVMVTEGEVIVVGDIEGSESDADPAGAAVVGYEVLCRQHHRRRLTAARAKAVSMVPDPLPFT